MVLKKKYCMFFKHGGLNSRDQSRSRSRTSFMSRLIFENRRECPSCWDQLFFFSVEIFKIEIFKIETWLRQDFHQDCRDFWDLLRLFKIYQNILILSRLFEVLHHQKSWQIEKSRSRNRIKLTNSWLRLRQTVKICQ